MRPLLETDSETLRKFAEVVKGLTEEGKIRVIVDGPSSVGFNISDEAKEFIRKIFEPEHENYEGIFREILTVIDATVTRRKNAFKEYVIENEKVAEKNRENIRKELDKKLGIIAELVGGSRVEKETAVKLRALLPVFAGIEWETKGATATSGSKKCEPMKSAIITISALDKFENPFSYIAGNESSITFESTLYDIEEILEELNKIEKELKG